jgi:hypothetical protein
MKTKLVYLQLLVFLQRSIRLILRATWLGGCGMLLAWALPVLIGWKSNPLAWYVVGGLFALIRFCGSY